MIQKILLPIIFAFLFVNCSKVQTEQKGKDNIDKLVRKTKAAQPTVIHAGPISSNILGFSILERYVEPADWHEYVKEEGDSIFYDISKDGLIKMRLLFRDGKPVGYIAGKDKSMLSTFEEIKGDTLQMDKFLDESNTYLIKSNVDTNFNDGIKPVAVYRKSKINTWNSSTKEMSKLHSVYLVLPEKMQIGSSYQIDFNGINVNCNPLSYYHNPQYTRSEAVHVNQMGFGVRDTVKRAYVSIWLGTGGPFSFGDSLNFKLIDNKSNKVVFEGSGKLAIKSNQNELLKEEKNYSKTEVWHLDFSEYNTPGTYKIYVEGIGCSYPFDINDNTWENCFKTTMMGLLHHRNGIHLEPPLTDYHRPRGFYPKDGFDVYVSQFSIIDNWMCFDEQEGVFSELLKNRTNRVVDYAWGGYMNGDNWNRCIDHLETSRKLMEIYELNRDYFNELKLNLPKNEVRNSIPDIIDEILWNLECYYRMQQDNGGIPYGIYSASNPVKGEPSWLESLPVFMFNPDPYSSYVYAGNAAYVSFLLKPLDPKKSTKFKISAIKAMQFSEKFIANDSLMDSIPANNKAMLKNERCRAAAHLYQLTEDTTWHHIFASTTIVNTSEIPLKFGDLKQLDAAFVYARLADSLTKQTLKSLCRNFVLLRGNMSLKMGDNNAFNLTHRDTGHPINTGFYSAINNQELCRCHHLTNDQKYLEAAILSAQFACGANPMNLSFTSGLGINTIYRPLHQDSKVTGQKTPIGTTVNAQIDHQFYSRLSNNGQAGLQKQNEAWAKYQLAVKQNIPSGKHWPPHEAYYGFSSLPLINGYTIHHVFGPINYAFGYLAGKYYSRTID